MDQRKVIQDAIDDAIEPFAQLPGDITGANLTGFISPVVGNDNGNSRPTFFGGLQQSSGQQVALSSDRLAEAHGTEPHYVSGYLFLNDGGSKFSSFTLPEALAGGDSQFRININGEGFDLGINEMFDFTPFNAEGVDSFLLVDIDESELIPTTLDAPPFTFGMTFATVGGSDFSVVPLVTVPEPGSCLLFGAMFLFSTSCRRRR